MLVLATLVSDLVGHAQVVAEVDEVAVRRGSSASKSILPSGLSCGTTDSLRGLPWAARGVARHRYAASHPSSSISSGNAASARQGLRPDLPLEQAADGYAAMDARRAIKALLRP
jgi:hypothetical protein